MRHGTEAAGGPRGSVGGSAATSSSVATGDARGHVWTWRPDGTRVAAPWAAMLNGTAAHALDFDDYDFPAASHPSAVLVPAVFALAEELGASGADVLDAYVVGYETMACIGKAVNMVHYERGWHSTATLGTLGATAACPRPRSSPPP